MSVTTEKTKRKRNKGGNLLLPGMTELPKPKVREIRTPEKTKDNKDIDKLANSKSDLTNNIDKLQEYSEKTTKFDRHIIKRKDSILLANRGLDKINSIMLLPTKNDTEFYINNRALIFAGLQQLLLEGLQLKLNDPTEFKRANLRDLALWFNSLYNNERLERNKTTANLGIAGIIRTAHDKLFNSNELSSVTPSDDN